MDPYSQPDQQNDASVDAMITRLEERGQHPVFLRLIDAYVAELPGDRAIKVLDLGCGTGVVTRRLASRLQPESVVHGADVSSRFLAVAGELAPESAIHWDHLECGNLPYADGAFDAVVMHTLLGHVSDPLQVIREAARVLTRDGQLVIFDADHAGTTYGLTEYEKTRSTDHKLVSAIALHPDICRQMPRLLKSAGLVLRGHSAEVLSECGRGDYWLSSVRAFARLIPALGILSEDEGKAWVDHMLKSHEDGTFFAAGVFYTFRAGKPC